MASAKPKTEDGGVRNVKSGRYTTEKAEEANPKGTVHERNQVGKKADPNGPEKTRNAGSGHYTQSGKEASAPGQHLHEHDPKKSK